MQYEKTDLADLLNTLRCVLERAPGMSANELVEETRYQAHTVQSVWESLNQSIELDKRARRG